MPDDKSEPLTRAQKEQLEAELAELEGPRRAAAVEAIATARAFGDLSENFEYHAAKNEQGLLERRITVLRDRLDRSVLVDEDAAGDAVGVGSKVEVEDEQGCLRTRLWARRCSARRWATRSRSRRPAAPGARV
jgi:transcription elongation factor GreA